MQFLTLPGLLHQPLGRDLGTCILQAIQGMLMHWEG